VIELYRSVRRGLRGALFAACAATLGALAPQAQAVFQDPASTPAAQSAAAAQAPLIAVARAGERIVAVGLRGIVVYSDDQGANWRQASVPVSTDLVAVSFPNPQQGWAVGHGGIVIHTEDGGASWQKQFDGPSGAELARGYYERRAADDSSEHLAKVLQQATMLAQDGTSQAFLDVYFENEREGYIVGTFNRIFRTDDGGKSWVPWMDRTDNPQELNFYSIRGDGGAVWMTGEQGAVWKLDRGRGRFERKATDYTGTLFGSLAVGDRVFVFGMRGSLFLSESGGGEWRRLEVPGVGGITGGVSLADGRLLLATQAGVVLSSSDGGKSFSRLQLARPMSYFGISYAPGGGIALVGIDGAKVERLP